MTDDLKTTNASNEVEQSILKRALRGGGMTVFGFGFSQIIRFCSNLIMTRFLVPDAFGLVAMAMTLQFLLFMVSDIGINASVIRGRSADNPDFVATAWVTQMLRGALLAIALILVAGLIFLGSNFGLFPEASVFNDWRLPLFVLAVALTSLVDGLRSMKLALCQRDIKLGRMILVEIGSQIISFILMLAAVMNGFGAWSFIVGMLALSIGITAGSYLFIQGPQDRFLFKKEYFKEIFHFGKWLMLSSITGFLLMRGDQFIFGAIMDRTQFGLYTIAMLWITVAITLYEKIMIQVAYTSFSELNRSAPAQAKIFYQNFRLGLDVVCFAVFIGIMLLADIFFNTIYPENYGDVSYYVKLLSIIILLLPYRLLLQVILASGSSLNVFVTLISPAIMIVVGTPMIYWLFGIKAAIIFSTLAFIPAIPVAWYFVRNIFPISIVRELPMASIALIAVLFLATN